MNQNIFIPTKRKTVLISDSDMIDQVINCYLEGLYSEMKGFILEYGEAQFFQDLVIYLDLGYWRIPGNKYYMFTGITIQFFKIYS